MEFLHTVQLSLFSKMDDWFAPCKQDYAAVRVDKKGTRPNTLACCGVGCFSADYRRAPFIRSETIERNSCTPSNTHFSARWMTGLRLCVANATCKQHYAAVRLAKRDASFRSREL